MYAASGLVGGGVVDGGAAPVAVPGVVGCSGKTSTSIGTG